MGLVPCLHGSCLPCPGSTQPGHRTLRRWRVRGCARRRRDRVRRRSCRSGRRRDLKFGLDAPCGVAARSPLCGSPARARKANSGPRASAHAHDPGDRRALRAPFLFRPRFSAIYQRNEERRNLLDDARTGRSQRTIQSSVDQRGRRCSRARRQGGTATRHCSTEADQPGCDRTPTREGRQSPVRRQSRRTWLRPATTGGRKAGNARTRSGRTRSSQVGRSRRTGSAGRSRRRMQPELLRLPRSLRLRL